MPRSLDQIKEHLRMAIANKSISTTLIQTEDLEALCAVADAAEAAHDFLTSKAHVTPSQRIENARIELADALNPE